MPIELFISGVFVGLIIGFVIGLVILEDDDG
jgi:hypothetical protein